MRAIPTTMAVVAATISICLLPIVSSSSLKAMVSDLSLLCDGTERKPGTSFKRKVQTELEFFWVNDSVFFYNWIDGTRTLQSENKIEYDDSTIKIFENNSTVYSSIERQSGTWIYKGKDGEGQETLVTSRCRRAHDGKRTF